LKNRICPICGDAERKVLFRQEFSPIAGASLFAGYDVVVCARCGFAFADDIPDQAAFDAYYRDLSKYEYDQREGAESPFDLARFRENVREFRPFIPGPEAQILEIGCSTARLLALLRDEGFPNVRGLDPSPSCATTAKRLYGIEVATGALADSAALGRSFDFVIGIGLLEHVRDLGLELGRIAALLRPGGLFFAEVPNVTGFCDYNDSAFQQFSVEHIDFFSAVSFENLLNAHGFATVRVWEGVREHSQGYMMPVASGVFRVGAAKAAADLPPDAVSEPALRAYIAKSRAREERLHATIDRLVRERTPLLVWGVGTHTQRLLATSRLAEANVRAFVDSNSKYRDRTIAGVPIIGPAEVAGRPEAILISSLMFQAEIERQIRGDLGYPNELVLLYDV